jgi:hypothetical protein
MGVYWDGIRNWEMYDIICLDIGASLELWSHMGMVGKGIRYYYTTRELFARPLGYQ